jgi:hypothetical protein
MTPEALEAGYWRAYTEFYKWGSIWKGALAKPGLKEQLRHVAYAGGWKKFESLWDWVIRAKRVTSLLPMLETVLTGFGSHPAAVASNPNAHTMRTSQEVGGDQSVSVSGTARRELAVLRAK